MEQEMKEKGNARRVPVVEAIRYNFTENEIRDLGKRLARASSNAEAAEVKKKEVDAQLKADIERHYAEASGLAERVNSGYEMRDTPCEHVYDFDAGLVQCFTKETADMVWERAMRPDERQMALPV